MRKQILSGLIAAVALLFSVVALTSAPASGQGYSSYPAAPGATITGVITPAAGESCPCAVTLVFGNCASITTSTAGDGTFSLPVPASAAGGLVDVVADGTVSMLVETAGAVVVQPTAVVVNPTAVVVNPGVPVSVPVAAVDYGFTNGVPTTPALAVTGTDTNVLGFIATGLIALGAVAMGSRRKFLQGALED